MDTPIDADAEQCPKSPAARTSLIRSVLSEMSSITQKLKGLSPRVSALPLWEASSALPGKIQAAEALRAVWSWSRRLANASRPVARLAARPRFTRRLIFPASEEWNMSELCRPRHLSNCVLFLFASSVAVEAPAVKKGRKLRTTNPSRRWPRDAWWQKRQEKINARAKQGDVDLLFIGDSITVWLANRRQRRLAKVLRQSHSNERRHRR